MKSAAEEGFFPWGWGERGGGGGGGDKRKRERNSFGLCGLLLIAVCMEPEDMLIIAPRIMFSDRSFFLTHLISVRRV